MSTPMKRTLLALLLAASALAAAPASAQDPARDIDSVLADQRVKRMTTVLTLTDEQKTKVRPLVLEEIKAFKTYRADDSLTEADRIRKEKEFRASARPKFKAILNEEQLAKYEQLQQEKRGKKPAKPAN
jgi:Spy/CpxP family protein refolding chaperone